MSESLCLNANWPAPKNILAFSTTRYGGQSLSPYHSNNLADHVGDNLLTVEENRQALITTHRLPKAPYWLEQTHSTTCLLINEQQTDHKADAAITKQINQPLVVLTADCLPILLCDKKGQEIAAIHAGWRGLLDGIIEETLKKLTSPFSEMMAWLGPRICGQCFEVGQEVTDAFLKKYPISKTAFVPTVKNKYLANLGEIATMLLKEAGIQLIYDSEQCTFENNSLFFSYRREGQTGRIANIICVLES